MGGGGVPSVGGKWEASSLKGKCHELRMRLSKFVCVNMPGFLATFRSQNLLFESNLKSSGCLSQVNCS